MSEREQAELAALKIEVQQQRTLLDLVRRVYIEHPSSPPADLTRQQWRDARQFARQAIYRALNLHMPEPAQNEEEVN